MSEQIPNAEQGSKTKEKFFGGTMKDGRKMYIDTNATEVGIGTLKEEDDGTVIRHCSLSDGSELIVRLFNDFQQSTEIIASDLPVYIEDEKKPLVLPTARTWAEKNGFSSNIPIWDSIRDESTKNRQNH